MWSFGLFFTAAITVTCVKSNVVQMKIEDEGTVKNCGKANFTLGWSPKNLDPSGKVTVFGKYTVPYDMNSGSVNVQVTFAGDEEPFLQYANPFTCNEIKQYIPCPLIKGITASKNVTIPNLRVLNSYPGTYNIEAKVYNEHKQEMFCGSMTITVREGLDYK